MFLIYKILSRRVWWVWTRSIQFALVLASTFSFGPALAGDSGSGKRISGPIEARVMRVIDGDTIAVRAMIWPGQHINVSVRLAGIDAPELRSKCRDQRNRAWRARNHLHSMIAGTTVTLHDIRHGKYAGRVVAEVQTQEGVGVSVELLKAGLASPSKRGRRISRLRKEVACASRPSRTAWATRP